MMNVDRAWARVASLPQFKGMNLSRFRYLGIGQQFTLTNAQVSGTTRVDFPSGAIILGITAGVTLSGQALTTALRVTNLDAIRVSIDYPNNESVITGGRMNGRAVFGTGESCEFPAKELVVPVNGSINYVVENLTTSTLAVDVLHHCIVPRTNS